MNALAIFLVSWFVFLGIFPAIERGIETDPKRLDKEIAIRFGTGNFNKTVIVPNTETLEGEVVQGRYYRIVRHDTILGYAYAGRVKSCRKDGCSIPRSMTADETSEFFDYFMLFNPKLEVVSVVVYNYEATHGQEITARGWLRQFIGYNGGTGLKVGKNVDAISGATISVYGIVDDIVTKTSLLRKII